MTACNQPPLVRRLIVSEIADTHATLQWQLSGGRSGYYGLELSYKKRGELPSTQYQLSKWETLAVVRDLQPNTTYLSTLFTANQCARTDPAIAIFRTKVTMLHPNILKVMPHELILTSVVMFIWVMIMRHFFRMYSHVAMVNPVTYGGYRMGGGEELAQKQASTSSLSMRTPRTSLVPSSGNATLGSVHERRQSTTSRPALRRQHSSHSLYSHQGHISADERATLLAGAVDKWRSEAILAHMGGIAVARPPVHSSVLRTAQSWTDIRQAPGIGKRRRRSSTMSAAAPKHSAPPVVRISIEEEDEEELELEDTDDGTGDRKGSKGSIGSFSRPRLEFRSASLNVATAPERKRKIGNGPEIATIYGKGEGDVIAISTLLLGKATTDIRRCSSPPQFDVAQISRLREVAEDRPKLSRLAFFSSLRRKTQKAPAKAQMTMVTEEDDSVNTELTNYSDPYRDYNDHYHTDLQLEPKRVRVLRGKLLQSPADGYRQDSSDSYVTASEFPSRNNDSQQSTARV